MADVVAFPGPAGGPAPGRLDTQHLRRQLILLLEELNTLSSEMAHFEVILRRLSKAVGEEPA